MMARLVAAAVFVALSLCAPPAAAQLTFAPSVSYPIAAPAAMMTTGDLNRDGLPDVIVATTGTVDILYSNGDNTLAPAVPAPTAGGAASAVVSADFDGDGIDDIAFAGLGASVGILLSRGDGTFRTLVRYGQGEPNYWAGSLVAADFNRSGRLDLAIVNVGLFGSNPAITIFNNRGGGVFERGHRLPISGSHVNAADVNGDGYLDLLTANNNQVNTWIGVLLNTRAGGFAPAVDYPSSGAGRIDVGDLDGDGDRDLVLSANARNGVEVMLNQGGGTFAPGVQYSTGYYPADATVADFDGDGHLDVGTAVIGGNPHPLIVLRGRGDGTLAPASLIQEFPNHPASIVGSVDLDMNGAVDLIGTDASQNPSTPAVMVLVNRRLPPINRLRMSTNRGGNAGSTTLTLFGSAIAAGSTMKLACANRDIAGTGVTLGDNGTSISATFDLTGTTPGVCTVVLTAPNGSTREGALPFIVEEGGAPDVTVEVIGLNLVRPGPRTFYVILRNAGNVDSGPVNASVKVTGAPGTGASAPVVLPIDTRAKFVGPLPVPLVPFIILAIGALEAGRALLIPIKLDVPQSVAPPVNCYEMIAAFQMIWRDPLCPVLKLADEAADRMAETIYSLRLPNLLLWFYGLLPTDLGGAGRCYNPQNRLSRFFCDTQKAIDDSLKALAEGVEQEQRSICAFATGRGCNINCNKPPELDDVMDKADMLRSLIDRMEAEFAQEVIDSANMQRHFNALEVLRTQALSLPGIIRFEPNPPDDRLLPDDTRTGSASHGFCAVNSFDPNEKHGPSGTGADRYIDGNAPLSYIIQFENQPTATAPAQEVVITDPLDASRIDLTTVQLGPIDVAGTQLVPPPFSTSFKTTMDLRPGKNLVVRVDAHVNLITGVVTWRFESRDPLTGLPPDDPLAGFLDPGAGGSVTLLAKPAAGLATGSVIANQASIVFDTNAPIATQVWSNRIDASAPSSTVLPLPVTVQSTAIRLQWSGADNGAGLREFTIYVSDNGGPFTIFQENTADTAALFRGQVGHTYSFYSIARDAAGNVEPPKTIAEAATTMVESVQYFSEGATGSFFETRFALFNPNDDVADAVLEFSKESGETLTLTTTLPARARRTIVASAVAGLEDASFSTVIRSTEVLVADRTMSWDRSGYGSHAETGLPFAASEWYLAEGSTSANFTLFYLLQNPNEAAVSATVRYLRPFGLSPIDRSYDLPPRSRVTIPVDEQSPELAGTDVSAVITSSSPIIVERAMYWSTANQVFAAGHESAGVTVPSTRWFLAEGATGQFFDMFILLANPSTSPASVRADYLLSTGETFTKTYAVPANGRHTIYVDEEDIPGAPDKPLANVAVSSTLTSLDGIPILVERTMWWPGIAWTSAFWTEAHNSPGATATGTMWALAEGEVGGASNAETYVLVANVSPFVGEARVSLYFEDGTSTEQVVTLMPSSRTTINMSQQFPETTNRRFAVIVESLGAIPARIVVERAMYTSPNGNIWTAGTNALATQLR